MSDIGHNSGNSSYRVTKDELEQFAQRIERLKDEKAVANKEYADQIKEVRAECKGRGFDLKALDAVMKLRAMEEDTRAVVHMYVDALEVFG